jgi:hypothetical protein
MSILLTFASPCFFIKFKYINQQDATVPQAHYVTFICNLTCFGRLSAHHQELTTALLASGSTASRKILMKLEFSRQVFEKHSNILIAFMKKLRKQ